MSRHRDGLRHFTVTFENYAFVHTQAWRENITPKDSGMMDFDTVFCANAPVDFTADDNNARFYVTVNTGSFSNNQCIRSIDFPAERSPDTDGALEAKLALELTAVVDDPGYPYVGHRYTQVLGTTHSTISLKA